MRPERGVSRIDAKNTLPAPPCGPVLTPSGKVISEQIAVSITSPLLGGGGPLAVGWVAGSADGI